MSISEDTFHETEQAMLRRAHDALAGLDRTGKESDDDLVRLVHERTGVGLDAARLVVMNSRRR